ncbi:hypothetical protein AnaeK_3937 [Anaeromyxobacter sp. K]|nr:hypothetical protein AnaeK_3937 [Anaeromyxobacter sp. K]
MNWLCRQMQRGEINQDPVQEEFFTSRDNRAEGLVREAVQNTLDAAVSGPVRIRFAFSANAMPAKTAAKYLQTLAPHVSAALGPEAVMTGAMDFLTIEDFGTRGLGGDPEQDRDVPGQTTKNDFYYFWRNVGRSSKSDTDRGRWGVGKIVYPAASRTYAFFGLTVRAEDGCSLLMGQAVLKVHDLDGHRFCPYPYFGVADDNFCLPVQDDPAIEKFRNDFELQRVNEPGLSIVIPYARTDEITPDDILRAAIRNYFFPVLAGTLVVEVKGAAGEILLNATTIREVAAKLDWSGSGTNREQLERLFDLAAWAIGLEPDKYIELAQQGVAAPEWSEDLLAAHNIAKLRERYEGGERLAFRVPVKVHRKGAPPVTATFRAYVGKDDSIPRGEEHYIRQGITIADIRMVREAQARGLVVVEDAALSALLGDSEGPAHTDWSEREGKLKQRYQHGPSCVRFVKNTLRRLVAYLSRPPEGLDEKLLSDVFYVERSLINPGSTPVPRGPGPAKPDDPVVTPPPPPPPPPPPTSAALKLVRIDGGFRITGREGLRGAVSVEAAYEVRRGNAFKRYDRNDFDLGKKPIAVAVAGAKIARAKDNRLELVVDDDTFEVKVTGFDRNRDLAVRARHLEDMSETEEDAA